MRIRSLVSSAVTVGGTLLGLWFGANTQPNSAEPTPTQPTSVTVPSVTPTAVPRATEPTSPGVMPQADFPCHEDEALLYHPRFGPDMVGCVHLDEVRNTTW